MTTGLYTPQRQCNLLRGLAHRCQDGVRQWQSLGDKHARQVTALIDHQQKEKKRLQTNSEEKLRNYLKQWDDSDERKTADYEHDVLQSRIELNRLTVEFRRRHRHGIGEIDRQCTEAKQNATKVYESKKVLPGKQKARDNNRLNAGWNAINERLERAREVALKRLQKLEEPPSSSSDYEKPASVDKALRMLDEHTAGCDEKLETLNDDFAIRFLESFYPALVGMLSYVLWAAAIYLIQPEGIAVLWYAAGILAPITVIIACFAIFTPRVKRVTRERYPLIEQHAVDAIALVKDGQERAVEDANQLAQKIKDEHVTALRQAEENKVQQIESFERELQRERDEREKSLRQRLVELEEGYNEAFAKLEATSNIEFTSMSAEHQEQLDKASKDRATMRAQLAAQQREEDETVARRLRDGLKRGLGRIDTACERMEELFPDWDEVLGGKVGTADSLALAPVGFLNSCRLLKEIRCGGIRSGW